MKTVKKCYNQNTDLSALAKPNKFIYLHLKFICM